MTSPGNRSFGHKPLSGYDKMSIILADSSTVLRRNVRKLISNTDCTLEIHEAETVCDTLCYLQRHTVDLLILDLQFPDGTGFDVLKKLSLLDIRPSVVVLTNFPSEVNRVRARELGADYFLDKSYEYEQVLSILEKLCLAHAAGQSTKSKGTHVRRQG